MTLCGARLPEQAEASPADQAAFSVARDRKGAALGWPTFLWAGASGDMVATALPDIVNTKPMSDRGYPTVRAGSLPEAHQAMQDQPE